MVQLNTYTLPNGQHVTGQNLNGYLANENNDFIFGLYFRGTGKVPQKYRIMVGCTKDGEHFVCGSIGTHSGQIQEQHSTLYGLWSPEIEAYKAKLTKDNYQQWWLRNTPAGLLHAAQSRVKMLEDALQNLRKQSDTTAGMVDTMMAYFFDEKGMRDEFLAWKEKQSK